MSTTKKPVGYFKHILAIDCETTGLSFSTPDPSIGHQAVSWGIVVADADTLKPVEELYVEIKWNEESKATRKKDPKFGTFAEGIHGLTKDHLEKNGIEEEEAVVQILNLIVKYWGPSVCVKCLGHNVHMFDVPFLRAMCERHGITLKFGNRHVDSSSLGFGTLGTYNSDDLFKAVGFDARGDHNALADAKMALESVRRIKAIWKKVVG